MGKGPLPHHLHFDNWEHECYMTPHIQLREVIHSMAGMLNITNGSLLLTFTSAKH